MLLNWVKIQPLHRDVATSIYYFIILLFSWRKKVFALYFNCISLLLKVLMPEGISEIPVLNTTLELSDGRKIDSYAIQLQAQPSSVVDREKYQTEEPEGDIDRTGLAVWWESIYLCSLIVNYPEVFTVSELYNKRTELKLTLLFFKDKNVLELGCGTAVVGLFSGFFCKRVRNNISKYKIRSNHKI
jgi:hypothetical protein